MFFLPGLFVAAWLCLATVLHVHATEIFICDAGNLSTLPGQILRVDENGENAQIYINSNLSWPQDILFLDEMQEVLVSNFNSGRITRYDLTTGGYLGNFATGLANPTRMKIGADGLLYVLQWGGNGTVRRYELDGTSLGAFTTAGVTSGIGLDWDAQLNLYVSSYYGATVRRFDPEGNDLGLFIQQTLVGPTNLWFAGSELRVLDYNSGVVSRFDEDGVWLGSFITGLGQAEGVDFFANGQILIGNGLTHSVKLFDGTGAYVREFVANGTAGLITPNAIVIREADVSVPDRGPTGLLPTSLELLGNWPNPFNPSTTIEYRLRQGAVVQLTVHDLQGGLVALLEEGYQAAGLRRVPFNGSALASGVYLITLRSGSDLRSERMLLLK